MSTERLIGIHIEDGVVQRITAPAGETAILIEDGKPTRALQTSADDGETADAAPAALESTRCHGIGIACDLIGERMLQLGRTQFDDSKEYVAEIVGLLEQLRELVVKSMRLEPGLDGAQ